MAACSVVKSITISTDCYRRMDWKLVLQDFFDKDDNPSKVHVSINSLQLFNEKIQ
jgi:hypothetical protein